MKQSESRNLNDQAEFDQIISLLEDLAQCCKGWWVIRAADEHINELDLLQNLFCKTLGAQIHSLLGEYHFANVVGKMVYVEVDIDMIRTSISLL